MSNEPLSPLATLTCELQRAFAAEVSAGTPAVWLELRQHFRRQTGVASDAEFADAAAQATTCGCFGLQSFATRFENTDALAWLVDGTDPLVRHILLLCRDGATAQQHSPAVRCTIERIVNALEQEPFQASHWPPTGVTSSAKDASLAKDPCPARDTVYFYEQFLAAYDRATRRRHGVFYTPHAIVSFIVRSIDACLSDDFSLADGLADTTTWQAVAANAAGHMPQTLQRQPFVRLLDPALGTGAFLLEAAKVARQRFCEKMDRDDVTGEAQCEAWNAFVSKNLLPRLWGQELMLAPLLLAQLGMLAWLAETGFRFERAGELHFLLANTLQQPTIGQATQQDETAPFTIVLGNPPFSGVSENRQAWMRDLLRGKAPNDDHVVANYFRSGDRPLQERKHWLQDDYVKFMRFAHWQIEEAGAGIVAMVTNHGYLENTTFRGMREQLLTTFPLISVIDLHGSTRSGGKRPDGTPDESVFKIEQGVAIGLLRRPLDQTIQPSVKHSDLWGSRTNKLQKLLAHDSRSLETSQLKPKTPHFFLAPKDDRRLEEYQAGFRLCDIMPVNSTAVVTARDHFVVAFDTEELLQRMRTFADLNVPDDEIRAQFFSNTRSRLYQPGDTRGWRLPQARRRLHQEQQWHTHIRACLYRPFDQRQIFWAEWMIDWPRKGVMKHLDVPGNLALVARRQTPPSLPSNYFWVSDVVAIDGVVRSDNRGSESVFPLYLADADPSNSNPTNSDPTDSEPTDSEPTDSDPTLPRSDNSSVPRGQPNFSDPFIEACCEKLDLTWDATEPAHDDQSLDKTHLTPRCLFDYIYALFHCPSYRLRFAEQLRVDFPRVLVPRQQALFFAMAKLGNVLVAAHRLHPSTRKGMNVAALCEQHGASPDNTHLAATQPEETQREGTQPEGTLASKTTPKRSSTRQRPGKTTLERGYPKYRDQTVWLNKVTGIGPVPSEVWEYHVGTYQVCRKWLVDRRQRTLSDAEIERYCLIVQAIEETLHVGRQLDQEVVQHGDWSTAF